MLNIREIFLRKFLLIFSILLLSLSGLIYYWIEDFHKEQTKESLINNIKIIALNIQNKPNLDLLAQEIKSNLGLRLTLIDLNGTVVAESDRDKKTMENHKYRAEILQANTQKYGFKIRDSKSLGKKLLYVVKRYDNLTPPLYIRLSKEIKNIDADILGLGVEIVGFLLLFSLFVLSMLLKANRKIESEITKIANFLSSLTKKKRESYIRSELSQEFYDITSLLTKVAHILLKKEKQKSKFTEKLQASNRQKDDIISAISHEFKNPIAVINGYSQTLMDDRDINANIRQKFLTKIYQNGIKLSDLIDTLRLSSKLDSGQQEMQFKTINLYEILKESAENINLNYAKRQVIINGEKSITIKADSSLFGVVITNLIENAFKYSEDEVVIDFDKNSLSVSDTGIGISQKNLDNITNKFYRVNENSWNNSLGLGLFIVNNILKLHHFKLEIESQEHEGSSFKVIF